MSFLGSFACVKRVQELTNFFKLTLGLHIKTYSQYGALIFFCYLKKKTKNIYRFLLCNNGARGVDWQLPQGCVFTHVFLHHWYPHPLHLLFN